VLPILGTDPRSKTGKKIFSAAPLADNKGYLYVLLADQLRDSVIRTVRNSTALRLGFWSGAAVVILVFSLGVLMFNLLTRRLRQLESAMTSFRQHDFVLAAPPMPEQNRFRDEIDKLQGIFGEMSQRISEQVQGLRQVDTLRRELITNVSHDLRTPLAALQAYLETLQLKDTSLSLEQKRAYLSAAQKHSERLGKLIGDLFDLSRLEADAVEAQLEAFPIQELAQDVLLKFDGLAAERQIKLGLQLDEALPFIRADIGLIERVLTNLIDNALRYTPAGGSVTIRLRRQGKAVEVAVQDTGKGIAEKDIPHVFDRFYRADKYEAEGTGLGLAITKRILELHGQAILIESALGKGSTFSFKLLTQS
jgi:signal transduction histidine kinase